jgi:peptide/nickel transport system substrate-binding protein
MKRLLSPTAAATRPLALCAAAALAVTVLVGCSSSANQTAATGGATLTIQGDSGSPTLVEIFKPFQGAELHGTYLIYEPLEIPSPIDGRYSEFLATGHKFTDPTTLVYTIRQGVKWSDGKDFTAADVVFTFNLLKQYPALDSKGIWQQVSAVSGTGNDVTVTFKSANVPFASTVAQTPIVPQHVWSSISDPA